MQRNVFHRLAASSLTSSRINLLTGRPTLKTRQTNNAYACSTTVTTSSSSCDQSHYFSSSTHDVSGRHGSYLTEYRRSLQDPEQFWSDAARKLEWFKEPSTILSQSKSNPNMFTWYPDGLINTSYNCLDVHVNAGRGNQDALIYDSPLTDTKKRYTYSELLDHVSRFTGALQDLGVERGSVCVIYMPMIPEAIIAMLACSRIGAVHSVVFGGFAAPELATRITDCQPRVIISASAGIEPGYKVVPYKPLLDRALELADHNVERCVIVERDNVQSCELGPLDVTYDDVMAKAKRVDAVPLPSVHPHYILYTSWRAQRRRKKHRLLCHCA